MINLNGLAGEVMMMILSWNSFSMIMKQLVHGVDTAFLEVRISHPRIYFLVKSPTMAVPKEESAQASIMEKLLCNSLLLIHWKI